MLLYQEPFMGLPIYPIGIILLYIAAVLTLWSMMLYLRAALPIIFNNNRT